MKSLYKNSILILLLFVSSITQAQTHYEEIVRNKNKKIESIFTYNNKNLLDGETVHFYPNEKIKTIINFADGKANGIFQNYYNSGFLESSGILVNDLAEGTFEYFHENGHLKHKISYTNNYITGIKECYSYKKQTVYCGVVNNGNGFINIYDKKGNLIGKDIIKDGKMVKRESVNKL